jgi:flagellar biosynthesis protein FlhF
MQIQTFSGHTLVEALQQVKLELGDEAIILSSRRAEDPASLPEGHEVEVVAALPAPRPKRPQSSRPSEASRAEPRAWVPPRLNGSRTTPETRPAPTRVETPVAERSASRGPAVQHGNDRGAELGMVLGLKEDMAQMRRALRDVNRSIRFGPHAGWRRGADEELQRMDSLGISRQLACQLLDELPADRESASLEPALLKALARRLPVTNELPVPDNGRPALMALVGPTGAGKTTALVKLLLAPDGVRAGRGAILTLDTKRIAATEQVRRLAALAKLKVEQVYRVEEIPRALDRLSGCDWVLVDTPGAGPRERLGLERTRHLLAAIKPAATHLVLPANLSLADLQANLKAWKSSSVDRLLVTKLDEASQPGVLLELAEAAGLPFQFAGTGQSVNGDLVRLTSDLLAGIILDGSNFMEKQQR